MICKGGSTQNRWLLMGDFSKGGVHEIDGLWWVIFQRGKYTKPMAFDGFEMFFLLLLKIKRPGRLFRQIRYSSISTFSIFSSLLWFFDFDFWVFFIYQEKNFFEVSAVFGRLFWEKHYAHAKAINVESRKSFLTNTYNHIRKWNNSCSRPYRNSTEDEDVISESSSWV